MPARDHRAEPAPRVHRDAPRRAAPRRVRQQDGPGRLTEDVFERSAPSSASSRPGCGCRDMTFIPVSALHGDNVVTRSTNMPWFDGSPLLSHLERLHVASDRNLVDVRFPVQYVIRPQSHRHRLPRLCRHGRVRGPQAGRPVLVLPSGLEYDHRLDRDGRRPGRGGVPADGRDDHARRRASTSAAATCSAGRTTCRPSSRTSTRRCAGWTRRARWPSATGTRIKHTTRWGPRGRPRHRLPGRREHAPPRGRRHRAGAERDRPRPAARDAAAVRRPYLGNRRPAASSWSTRAEPDGRGRDAGARTGNLIGSRLGG